MDQILDNLRSIDLDYYEELYRQCMREVGKVPFAAEQEDTDAE